MSPRRTRTQQREAEGGTAPGLVVLDAEAVSVLLRPGHRKHQALLARLEASRRRQQSGGPVLVVPTSVRVEAGWDRREPASSTANRLRVSDAVLAASDADRAASVRSGTGVSVADSQVGALLATTPGPHVVLTSDGPDIRRVVAHVGADARVVGL